MNDTPYSDDKVYGGSENDNITVGIDYTRGNFYYIYGEAGSDYIKVVSSSAFINGGIDNDTIYCTGYECAVRGDEGDDEIHVSYTMLGVLSMEEAEMTRFSVMDTPLTAMKGRLPIS